MPQPDITWKPPGHAGDEKPHQVLVNTMTALRAMEIALEAVDDAEKADVYTDEETLNAVRVQLARNFAKQEQ